MKHLAYALILFLGSVALVVAQPYELKVKVTWELDPKDVDSPTEWILYACDKPITGEFSGNMSDNSLIGKCEGNLMTTRIPGDKREWEYTYNTMARKGTTYWRMSASAMWDGKQLESDLSNQFVYEYDLDDNTVIDRGNSPIHIDVERVKEIIIR